MYRVCVVLLLVCVMLFLVTSISAQQLRVMGVCRDFSTSMSEDEFKKVIPFVIDAVRVSRRAVDAVEGLRFAAAHRWISTEPVKRMSWGRPPKFKPFDESAVEKNGPPTTKIFRRAHDQYITAQRAIHAATVEQETAKYNSSVDFQLQQFGKYLAEEPQEPAECTRFGDLQERVAREHWLVTVMITDGWNDCGDVPRKPKDATGKIVIVLVPRQQDEPGISEAQMFEERAREMHRFFPDALIIQPYELASALESLLQRTTPDMQIVGQ